VSEIGGSRAPPIVNLVLSGELELRLIVQAKRTFKGNFNKEMFKTVRALSLT